MKKLNHVRYLITAIILMVYIGFVPTELFAIDHHNLTHTDKADGRMSLIETIEGQARPLPIYIGENDQKGISIAATNLAKDFGRVCGTSASLIKVKSADDIKGHERIIIAASIDDKLLKPFFSTGILDRSQLQDKYEKYIIKTVKNPLPGVNEALIIAGSDRRGTIYGIYEISEQIGVSPWYDWADVPVVHHNTLYIDCGEYTAGEPAVHYRGIFLNDEGPCLMQWVKNTYGTDYGDSRFYARVFELLLRLRGNFMWPAMWAWAFYADDADNSRIADEMGIIIGTSHHEPMARSHQEWARKRNEYGAWNYATNQKTLDKFFADGVRRMKDTEDVVTIGMRGDGDEAMSADADVRLLKKIIDNQRKIIARETGRPASETPQVWALYKEVLDYYDAGLRVPDDVTLLLCDDNWGNVRRLPNAEERKHPGGWGMYYHVDYVGAPRNSKFLNCTPIQNMWEQLQLTYDYGVDRLWILNVGDLKPMEYPITLFLDMAWNPRAFSADNLTGHTLRFFQQQLGPNQAAEAARIFEQLCKYNGRVTPEMLDSHTYNLQSGEWKTVTDDFARLETEALRQFIELEPEYQDAYRQFILFPVQIMSNLYQMYYAQAMNIYLAERNMPEANEWGELALKCFKRDGRLMEHYNTVMSGGKWNGMMRQKHIGYTSWNDDFPFDNLPTPQRVEVESPLEGGVIFNLTPGVTIMEAPHFNCAENAISGANWTLIPNMGRTLGGMAVMPYTVSPEGASLQYAFELPEATDSVTVHVAVKSTLAFARPEGHRYTISLDGDEPVTVNFNSDMNEAPENIYTTYYPVIARRVVEKKIPLAVKRNNGGRHSLTLAPLDPGIVFEKIVIDYGGYIPQYLFGRESECQRTMK